jgi:5-methylthioribose kinase
MVSLLRIVALNVTVDSGSGFAGSIVTRTTVGLARTAGIDVVTNRNRKTKSKTLFTRT